MRLTLAIILAAPLVASAAPADTKVPPSSATVRSAVVNPISDRVCATAKPRLAGQIRAFGAAGENVTFDLHQAVVRHVDGCIVPAILRRDVDGARSGRGDSRGRSAPDAPSGLLRPL